MTHPQVSSLLPRRDGQASWIYTVGRETYLDLGNFESAEDWNDRRLRPLLRRARAARAATASFWAAIIATPIAFGLGITWLQMLVTGLLAAAVTALVVTSLLHREAKAGCVVARAGSADHQEMASLARVIAAAHSLRQSDLGALGFPVGTEEKLDPHAMSQLAKALLQMRFPRVKRADVRQVRQDLEQNVQVAIGARITTA